MSDDVPKLLKVVVISGGVMLLGGFLWVGAVVAQRASESAASIADKPVEKRIEQVTDCAEITLPRFSGAKVEFKQGEWHVATSREIRRYSECGELLQKATLARK